MAPASPGANANKLRVDAEVEFVDALAAAVEGRMECDAAGGSCIVIGGADALAFSCNR